MLWRQERKRLDKRAAMEAAIASKRQAAAFSIEERLEQEVRLREHAEHEVKLLQDQLTRTEQALSLERAAAREQAVLLKEAQQDVHDRWKGYEQMAQQSKKAA